MQYSFAARSLVLFRKSLSGAGVSVRAVSIWLGRIKCFSWRVWLQLYFFRLPGL